MKVTEYIIVILLIFAGMILFPYVRPYLPLPDTNSPEPTIIAIDVNSFTLDAIDKGSSDAVNEAINNISIAAQSLADKGYIVLNSDTVLAAPPGYIIDAGEN